MSAPEPDPTGPSEEDRSGGDRWARIIFWALLLYSLGLIVMVIEDALSHTFI